MKQDDVYTSSVRSSRVMDAKNDLPTSISDHWVPAQDSSAASLHILPDDSSFSSHPVVEAEKNNEDAVACLAGERFSITIDCNEPKRFLSGSGVKHILVVDDSPICQKVLVAMLEKRNYKV